MNRPKSKVKRYKNKNSNIIFNNKPFKNERNISISMTKEELFYSLLALSEYQKTLFVECLDHAMKYSNNSMTQTEMTKKENIITTLEMTIEKIKQSLIKEL